MPCAHIPCNTRRWLTPNLTALILTLFKVATYVKQYKDLILLHLPSSCPAKALLQRVTALLAYAPPPVVNTS